METTITILKEHTPTALLLLVAGFLLQNDLGGEIQEIRADMAANKEEIRADIAALRADMNEEFKAVRAEIADTNERLARVETRLDSIEDRLYADTALPPM